MTEVAPSPGAEPTLWARDEARTPKSAVPFALTDEQRAAVEWGDGPLMVLAGAGTGKTTVIVERVRWLVNPVRTPEEAWQALRSGQTTHVVVHTGAWDADYAAQLDQWLASRGARAHGSFDGAVVYELPPLR